MLQYDNKTKVGDLAISSHARYRWPVNATPVRPNKFYSKAPALMLNHQEQDPPKPAVPKHTFNS